ncbi:MAG: HD-GYP domain-containing protein [Azoarcus sp.]|jgi:HD-GYP domain-containing protein (c-di-GMP phosphodiesterase class II)|nr:HD-GYP domain-containing protein [Azoarcus sp.]
MIKLIPIAKLQVGMYIHDLNCAWLMHDFLRNSFLVDSEKTLQKVVAIGMQEVYIDVSQGIDVGDAPTQEEARREVDRQINGIADRNNASPRTATLGEERRHARKLHVEANRIVYGMMHDVRIGKQIEIEQIEPMVERIVDSIFRQQDALLPLAQLKNHDEYTFQHSVSVCALMTTFARAMDMTRDVIHEIAIGALLHDVGKATVPDSILNKPGKLTDAEFSQMKSHVVQSKIILENTPGISPIALTVAAQHHERYDGSGYPNRLKGKDISCYGQMSSIVDVYDAITSDRCYHKGIPPTEALRKILEWSKFHFNPELTQVFIRALGIYPTGSLVRLESGRLGIVEEQHPDRIMLPKVKTIFHVKGHYLKPEIIDLRHSQDRIVAYENFEQWKIDPAKWKD